MRWIIAAAVLCFSGTSASASPYPPLEAAKKTVSKPALVERYGAAPLQTGELRVPPGRGPFPVAVVIHGGCWSRQFEDLAGTAPLSDLLTKRGIATWNIEYRALGDEGAGWPGTFEDVAGGVDHVRKLAKRYPLDLKRAAVIGHSAGAHLALWAASRPRLAAPWSRGALRPVAVAAIDGPGSLREFVGTDKKVCGRSVIASLLGGSPADQPARYSLASPIDHLPLGIRTLLVRGALGFSLEDYAAKARAAGEDLHILDTAKDNHFDMITPGQPNGEKTADWLAATLFAAQPERRSTKK